MLVVKYLRLNQGKTQTQLASETRLPQHTISNIERGIQPTPEQVRRLAIALGVRDPRVLLQELPDIPSPGQLQELAEVTR